MGMKRTLRKIAEKMTGTYISRGIPFGVNIAHDLCQKFPNYRVEVVFDVGANVGQSALHYVSAFPASTIYCFEPITETFEALKRNVENKKQVLCYNFALGNSVGMGTMLSKGMSTMNCLLHDEGAKPVNAKETESVNVTTLDNFCETNNVSQISYLKVDTEGGDLNVLVGCEKILNVHGIDFVEVEAGMNPDNKHHVPLETLKSFLEKHGYYIFGIYEQVPEWPKKEPHLRRTNIVFVSQKLIRDYNSN